MKVLKYILLKGKLNKRLDGLVNALKHEYVLISSRGLRAMTFSSLSIIPRYHQRLQFAMAQRVTNVKATARLRRLQELAAKMSPNATVQDNITGQVAVPRSSSDGFRIVVLERLHCACRDRMQGYACAHLRAAASVTGGMKRYD